MSEDSVVQKQGSLVQHDTYLNPDLILTLSYHYSYLFSTLDPGSNPDPNLNPNLLLQSWPLNFTLILLDSKPI